MPRKNSTPLCIQGNRYAMMAAADDSSVEITMYGDVVEETPRDWWGNPVDGEYIVLSEFLSDLDRIRGYKNIVIRLNSYGGDAVSGFVIHNKIADLVRDGKNVTCIVEGVAMSAASIIMAACNNVQVHPASLVMIHRCWTFLWGGYNADDLRQQADSQDAYDRAIVAAYATKTGLSETVLMHMMSDTTYMTGREAVEKGFADEVIQEAEPLNLAASADGRSIFVRGHKYHMAPGMFVPDAIPTISTEEEHGEPESSASEPEGINIQPEVTGGEEGGSSMTIEELRAQNPELVEQIEAAARTAGNAEAAQAAVEAERARMQEIDAVAGLFSVDLVNEARYGETACSAQELAYRAAQQAAAQGSAFLAQMSNDNQASGAEDVGAAPVNEGEGVISEEDEPITYDQAKAKMKALLNSK